MYAELLNEIMYVKQMACKSGFLYSILHIQHMTHKHNFLIVSVMVHGEDRTW